MVRALPALLLSSLLAGCSSVNDLCSTFLGDYAGTFDGDASGALTLTVTEDGADEAAINVTLEGESFAAIGNGTVTCEDGELTITLTDDAGNPIGTFTGSMIDALGEWSLDSGESGAWTFGE